MMKKIQVSLQTPKEIVNEMNKYIIGQTEAKKAVAIAFVNRYRRMMIEDEKMRSEICPKNVMLYGPTGVGKTEIARRVADITDSPFIKVEMTKFTEVGYAGKDVESIIRDLVDITIKKERNKIAKEEEERAKKYAIKYVAKAMTEFGIENVEEEKLANGFYDNQEIQIELPKYMRKKTNDSDPLSDFGGGLIGGASIISIVPMFEFIDKKDRADKGKKELKTMKVREALESIVDNEIYTAIDKQLVIADILKKIEQKGVVFLDEIDKLISNKDSQSKGEVSREGVQRDLLPIIEGSLVQTKYGSIKTDHILFIAAGAFHENKVSDLMPEIQGRFPIHVELKSLTIEDFEHILTDIKYNLLEQEQAILKVAGIDVIFEPDGIKTIAQLAYQMNSELENTGARRLHSVMEKVMEEANYSAKSGSEFIINKKYVEKATEETIDKKVNVRKYMI